MRPKRAANSSGLYPNLSSAVTVAGSSGLSFMRQRDHTQPLINIVPIRYLFKPLDKISFNEEGDRSKIGSDCVYKIFIQISLHLSDCLVPFTPLLENRQYVQIANYRIIPLMSFENFLRFIKA